MKKIQIMGLALFAVFAFGAITTSAAFAESEWLVEKLALAAPLPAETEGLLELVKFTEANSLTKLTAVDCEGILDGTIGPGALDTIEDVLNLSMETIGELESTNELALECKITFDAGASTDCKEGTIALVWVDNLNLANKWTWETKVVLSGTTFLDVLGRSSRPGGTFFPGYEVECESLFLGVKGTELCENKGNVSATLTNAATTPASVLGTVTTPEDGSSELVNCTMTGENSNALEGSGKTWAVGPNGLGEELETSVS